MRALLFLIPALIHAQPGFQYFISGNPADVRTKTTPGVLLAGGGKDVDAAFRWFLARAGGGDALVLRASGGDAYQAYFLGLAKLDSVETIVFKSSAASRDPFVLDKIRRAEAIFLAGGDQWNYIRYWHNTPVAEALNDAIRRGVPIGGTSAGLAVLGEFAFSAKHSTVTSAEALANPLNEKIAIHRGLLRIPGLECLITDSHFSRRDRMGRLLVFLNRIRAESQCQSVRGIGIDERAAVTLDETGQAQVAGEGSAYLITRAGSPSFHVTALPTGTVFDWGKWTSMTGRTYRLTIESGVVKSTSAGIYGTQ
ncbi:MAG: cyanophycinase [Acidobacteria bacterium]|nr:cyanophycinase [Acidobacteriota bacterium]